MPVRKRNCPGFDSNPPRLSFGSGAGRIGIIRRGWGDTIPAQRVNNVRRDGRSSHLCQAEPLFFYGGKKDSCNYREGLISYAHFIWRSVAQPGSAFGSGPKGRGFKSLRSDHLRVLHPWWNWQTRKIQVLMLRGVWVRVPPGAPILA